MNKRRIVKLLTTSSLQWCKNTSHGSTDVITAFPLIKSLWRWEFLGHKDLEARLQMRKKRRCISIDWGEKTKCTAFLYCTFSCKWIRRIRIWTSTSFVSNYSTKSGRKKSNGRVYFHVFPALWIFQTMFLNPVMIPAMSYLWHYSLTSTMRSSLAQCESTHWYW
jgi:hypothetical protein